MREHLRLDSTDQDTYIATLIDAATRTIEARTDRQFITATWKLHLPCFWSDAIELPRAPLQAVSSVTYTDTNGDTQTLGTDFYTVVTESLVGRVHTAYGKSLPPTRSVPQAVTITYTAGDGDAATDVPATAVHAVKMLAAHWYNHAEPVTVHGSAPANIPATLERLEAHFTARGAL